MRSLTVFICQNIGADAPWPGLSSSAARTLGRHTRYPADTCVADQHVRGPLVERRCPLEPIVLLELQERPLCRRTRDAVEGAIVEPNVVKLHLCPPDIIFRETRGIHPVMRRCGSRIRKIISVGNQDQSSATDP